MMKKTTLLLLTLLMCVFTVMAVSCDGDGPETPATTAPVGETQAPVEKITLTFEMNGGASIPSAEVEKGSDYALPTPEREGYRFDGWYATAAFEGSAMTSVNSDVNITVYAKWVRQYAVTLDLAGGALSSATLYVDEGAVIYDAVKELKPEKAGSLFDAWYVGDKELSKTLRMSEGGITLTAKYKTAYTVELYTQKLTGEGYELSETLTFYAYSGSTLTIADVLLPESMNPFRRVEHADTVGQITVSDHAAANVMCFHFDRKEFTVSFQPNYPDGSEGARETFTVLYGASVAVPSDYIFDGYCLIGWATSADGEVVYKASFLEKHLYGSTEAVEDATFEPVRNTTLYGVWVKGYRDMFAGGDTLYRFEDRPEKIYLYRGGNFFEGTYTEKDSSFIFMNDGKVLMQGILATNESYVYYDTSRAISYTLYTIGAGLDSTVTVHIDEYNNLTYSQKLPTETVYSYGTFTIDENGMYTVVFPETYEVRDASGAYIDEPNGPMAGKTLVMIFGSVQGERAFQIRNEEEFALGTIYRGALNEGAVTYYPSVYQMQITGFGQLLYNAGTSTSAYFYTYTNVDGVRSLTLMNSSGNTAGVIRLEEMNGKILYFFYTESQDLTIEGALGGSLKLDGTYKAVHTDLDGKETEGFYTLEESAMGGVIVTFYAGNDTSKFLVTVKTRDRVDENGATVTVNTYFFEPVPMTYAEYYYKDINGIYYAPLVVVDRYVTGKAVIYGYTAEKTYLEMATADYTVNADGSVTMTIFGGVKDVEVLNTYMLVNTSAVTAPEAGVIYYTYDSRAGYVEATELTAWEEGVSYFVLLDFKALKSFVVELDTTSTSYAINYWTSYTDQNDNTVTYGERYTSTDGDEMFLIGGIAVIKSKGLLVKGEYSINAKGVMTITTPNGTLYAELNETDKTFIMYITAPYSAYILRADMMYSGAQYVEFDGKGGATYVIITPATEEGAENTEVRYVGSFEITELDSLAGNDIYHFSGKTESGEELSFNYIIRVQQNNSGYTYFVCREDTERKGMFTSENQGRLELDGFNYAAIYTDVDGVEHRGSYYSPAEDVIYLYTQTQSFYMDLKTGNTFTVRGSEYATYILFDNQISDNLFLTLDGYGKLSVMTYQVDENGDFVVDEDGNNVLEYIDENGTYTVEGDVYTLKYTNGSDAITMIGKLTTYEYNGYVYNVFSKIHEEAVKTYVNKNDWSTLILDNIGNATMYEKNGAVQEGKYTLITPAEGDAFGLLYYINNDSTDACIYQYWSNGDMVQVRYPERGYYTEDLQSLIFHKYGFAIFNADTRYYYFIDENDDVLIFRQDPDADPAQKNVYGFVTETFGSFDEVKQYNGKTYYENNSARITFERSEQANGNGELPYMMVLGSNRYEFKSLSFTPNGEAEFSVKGTLAYSLTDASGTTQSATLSCTVIRALKEDGSAELYFTIPLTDGSIYRHDISINYRGASDEENKSSYAIIGKQRTLDVDASMYVFYSYLYSMFGQVAENTFGSLSIVWSYNAEGEIAEKWLEVTFGESTNLTDYDGNRIVPVKSDFTEMGSNVYMITLTADDGYEYNLYFSVGNSGYGVGYSIYALTRLQTLELNENLKVTVERVVTSEQSLVPGKIVDVQILVKDGDTYVEADQDGFFTLNDELYVISRTREEGSDRILSTVYYILDLVEKTAESVEGEENTKVEIYLSATVQTPSVKTYYDAEARCYVDVDTDAGRVLLIDNRGTTSVVDYCEYDAATGTYSFKTSTHSLYTMTLTQVEGVDVVVLDSPARTTVYYSEDGMSMIIVSAIDNKVLFANINGTPGFVDASDYNEADKTYTMTVGETSYTAALVTVKNKTYVQITPVA